MKSSYPSISVRQSLRRLGEEIRQARLRQRLPLWLLAERAMICRATLNKIQRGDPSVAMGSYAAVIFSLGFKTPFDSLISYAYDPRRDFFETQVLPKRIRVPREENSTTRIRKPNLVCLPGTKGRRQAQEAPDGEDNKQE